MVPALAKRPRRLAMRPDCIEGRAILTTIDKVFFTPRAVYAWQQLAMSRIESIRAVVGDDIPDEDVEEVGKGRLRLHVTHPDHGVLLQLILPPEDWSWIN